LQTAIVKVVGSDVFVVHSGVVGLALGDIVTEAEFARRAVDPAGNVP
jgi:hypothetical protein